MKNTTIKETGKENVDATGSSFQGNIVATYEQLKSVFGDPEINTGPEEKFRYQWTIKFLNGEIATIYDWKINQKLHLMILKEIKWNIGGYNMSAVGSVHTEFHNKLEEDKEELEEKLAYFYLKLKHDNLLIAVRRTSINGSVTWEWGNNLSQTNIDLIEGLHGNAEIVPGADEEAFGCYTLSQLRSNINETSMKEWEVELEFSYEVDVDLGIAGEHTAYGTDAGCMIEVEAVTKSEAAEKAELLLLDESDITDAVATDVVEV